MGSLVVGSVVVGWGGGVGWWWVLCRPSRVAGGCPWRLGFLLEGWVLVNSYNSVVLWLFGGLQVATGLLQVDRFIYVDEGSMPVSM